MQKKAVNLAAVLLVITCLLTACSFSRSVTRPVRASQLAPRATQTIPPETTSTEYLDPTPTDEIPTPAPTATPADYPGQVSGIITEYKAVYNKFDDIHTRWSDNHSLLTDSTWRMQMQSSLIDMQTVSNKMLAIKPLSEHYTALNNYIQALGTEIGLLVSNYTIAIKKSDPEPIKQVTVNLENMLVGARRISIVLEAMGFAAPTPASPLGATALCADGTYSYASSHRGACSHHGGARQWFK